MSRSEIKVTKQFAQDFILVAKHYMLEELGEIEEAKKAARNDMANAEISYRAMADEIRA